MRFSRYVVDNKSHYFASERSRNCVSFAHGYSSNIRSDWWIQAYACKHATLSFLSRLSCPTHYQMEMERFELLTPCLQGRCSPNWATPPDSLSMLRDMNRSISNIFYFFLIRQPPALPHRLQCSTIGRLGLNHRVRDGNGCVPQAHRHQKFLSIDNSTVKQPLLILPF